MKNRCVFLLVALLLTASGCLTPVSPDGDVPEPEVSDVDKAVERARRLYLPALGEQFKQAAAKAEAGEFKTDRDAHDFLSERNKLARDAAFRDVNELMQERSYKTATIEIEINGETSGPVESSTFDGKAAAKLYRELSEAMSK